MLLLSQATGVGVGAGKLRWSNSNSGKGRGKPLVDLSSYVFAATCVNRLSTDQK